MSQLSIILALLTLIACFALKQSPQPFQRRSVPSLANIGVRSRNNLGKSSSSDELGVNKFDAIEEKELGLDKIDAFLESRSKDLFAYADCTNLGPSAERSFLGILFLATNAPYLFVGLAMMQDRPEYNLLNIAGVISFVYHYYQLKFGPDRIEVRRCLLVDYCTAVQASLVFGLDVLELLYPLRDPNTGLLISADGMFPFITGAISLLCLWRSGIVDNNGRKYIFWHGLWHLFGALTAFEVGSH